MKYDDRKHTAYNEAGHTVAYYHFGIPLISVTIIPDNAGNDGLTTPEETEIEITKKIMISFAGPSAEQICLGEVSPGARGNKFDPYLYGFSEKEMYDLNNQITAILNKPKYQYAVETLANELLINFCFDGPGAYKIIKSAIKEYMAREGV